MGIVYKFCLTHILSGKACEGAPPNATSTYTSDYNTSGIYRFEDIVTYTCISTFTIDENNNKVEEPRYFSDGLQTR